MSTTQIPQHDMPYLFQRLERVKDCLCTDYLQAYLDASCKAWYLHTATTYLAHHLIEVYRRRVEKIVRDTGIEALPLGTRQCVTISTTDTGQIMVCMRVNDTDAVDEYTTLTQALEERYQTHAWNNLARRLAIDLSTWALETLQQEKGTAVVEAMSDTALDTALTAYVVGTDADPLSTRIRRFLNLTAQHVAFDLTTTIEARGPSLVELEHLLGFRKTTTRAARLLPLLREEHLTVLSAAHYQALREALAKNTFQHVEGIPWPTAQLALGPARGQAQLRPVVVDTMPLMPPEDIEAWAQRMWRQREELTDVDADALDTLSALWLYQAHAPQDDGVADVNELLAMRGLQAKRGGQGRRGGYMPAQRAIILQSLSHIQNLWLDMAEMEVYGETDSRTGTRRRKPVKQAIQSRAFTITDLFGHVELDGRLDVQKFIFRPGKVFAHFLFGPGRQTALLSAKALSYDPLRQTWEKRLARYLSYQWRCKARAGDYMQPFRVSTLLEAAGEKLNHRKPSKTRARLERALDTLLRDGVIAAWQYDRWDETLTERHGWARHWLQATILIEPPDVIRDSYLSLLNDKMLKQSAQTPTTSLGERIKRQRQEQGLSQLQAAEQLGMHQSSYSRLEHGKVQPSPAVRKLLEQWLVVD